MIRYLSLKWIGGILLLIALVGAFLYIALRPMPASTLDRLEEFGNIPTPELNGAVQVYWNNYAVPFIIADNDQDAAKMLGMVHAHLRLGQMEVAKRIAYGRISEMLGPSTNDLDAALRALNLAKAVPKIIEYLPPESRQWLEAYVDGVNHYKKYIQIKPIEMRLLSIAEEPWSVADSLVLGRLGGVDVNWGVMLALLPQYGSENWDEVWQQVKAVQTNTIASFRHHQVLKGQHEEIIDLDQSLSTVVKIMAGFARTGSNSIAVSGHKTLSGAPIIANDPHLGFTIPNFWLLAGLKSPSYHVVGATTIGVPVFAFGRNQHLAWGGTNIRQEASDLVNIPDDDPNLETITSDIKTRWWFDKTVKHRNHAKYGPIISDLAIIPSNPHHNIALRWTGHIVSDELSAMLKVQKASNWEQLLAAFSGLSLPGQNIIFATNSGDIGQILATWVPQRTADMPEDLLVSKEQSDEAWQVMLNAGTLPHNINPRSGVIASANNKPYEVGDQRINWYFPSDDRIKRLYELVDDYGQLTVDDFAALQSDVYSSSHHALQQFILFQGNAVHLDANALVMLDLINGWDGNFSANSRQAYLYHLVFNYLTQSLYQGMMQQKNMQLFYNGGLLPKIMLQQLTDIPLIELQEILNNALAMAYMNIEDNLVWGDIHRLKIQHLLGRAPVIGNLYQYSELPMSGHNATIFKTAGSLTTEKHEVFYGSQSRHLSDLSDLNANYFIMFGGQDGMIGSENFIDQVELWQNGSYIQIPLELDQVRARFGYVTNF